jgi:molecular chaperone HtpG
MLQDDAIIRRIRKSLVGRILKALAQMKEKKEEDFVSFYREFGRVLKEGVHFDHENRDKLKDLVLFASSKTEGSEMVSLKQYVERMPEGQKHIYYITGESLAAVRQSPLLEVFRKRDYEVLFMVDPIDEWMLQGLADYDGKTLQAVDRGDLDLEPEADAEKEEGEDRKAKAEALKPLLDHIRDKLEEDIREVRPSSRLTESACCLVADEAGLNAHMERIMRSLNQEVPHSKRIMEINPDHPLLLRMKEIYDGDPGAAVLGDYIELLHGQALLTEGSPLKNPTRFANLVSELMVKAAAAS